MVKDELILHIREKFSHGERQKDIKADLMDQGYSEGEIDRAIAKIQHDVFKQLPGVIWMYEQIEHLEARFNLTSPRMTVIMMIFCIVILFLFAGVLYVFFDPFGAKSAARDAQRQSDIVTMQSALNSYFQKNDSYPEKLDTLVPAFLPKLPHDPKTGAVYNYNAFASDTNYELCISYELQQEQCLNAAPVTPEIPVVPTDTPEPSFVPQSASGTPSTSPAY